LGTQARLKQALDDQAVDGQAVDSVFMLVLPAFLFPARAAQGARAHGVLERARSATNVVA
jgi:hypothetical protein